MAEYFKCGGYDGDGYPCVSEKVELIPGPRGPAGRKGARGEAGPRGEPGGTFTSTHLSAWHTGGIRFAVTAAGTAVPLRQSAAGGGFLPDEEYTAFVVPETGVYFLSYQVGIVQSAAVRTRIVKNGVSLSGSVRESSPSDTFFSATLIVPLGKGDTIGLQLYGSDVSVELRAEAGASFVAVRLA